MSIRIGILGYGNLGRGVECAIKHNPDLELVAVFTRRAPETVKILTETAAVYSVNDAEKMKDKIDVLIICGGSATDLPKQTPEYAKMFNVIDSSGKPGWNDENNHVIEDSLKLDSNPEFTSSVLVAYARAAYRMNKEGQSGAKTVFDVAPAYLCAADGAELRKHLL